MKILEGMNMSVVNLAKDVNEEFCGWKSHKNLMRADVALEKIKGQTSKVKLY